MCIHFGSGISYSVVRASLLFAAFVFFDCPRAFSQSGLLVEPPEAFGVFCDSNGGGTGECNRLDNNELLSCEFSSPDFIQCSSSDGYLSNCLNFAPRQFTCRVSAGGRLNSRGDCNDTLNYSSGCRPPLREKFTNSLPLLQKSDTDTSLPFHNQNQTPLNPLFPGTLPCDLYGDYCSMPEPSP